LEKWLLHVNSGSDRRPAFVPLSRRSKTL
jgi:hypothetical protein